MDKMQPLEVFGNDLASLKMNLGQKEQKFSKKAENGFLALILSNDSKMSSYFVRNDNFCMQKPWEAQIKKKIFCGKKTHFSGACTLNYCQPVLTTNYLYV